VNPLQKWRQESVPAFGEPNLPGSLPRPTVTGKAKNSRDILVPGRLPAKFLRSPQGEARAKNLGATEAKAPPGVVDAVLRGEPVMKAIPSRGDLAWTTSPV